MNCEFPSEAFSACLDGEATPEERAAVEREVRDSRESREFLADLRWLSRELQALPAHEPPEGFDRTVMAAIEREMLLPAQETGDPAQRRPARTAGRFRRFAPVVITAAVLLLALRLLGPSSPAPSPPRETPLATGKSRGPADSNRKLARLLDAEGNKSPAPAERANRERSVDRQSAGLDGSALKARSDPLVPPIPLASEDDSRVEGRLIFIDDLHKLSREDVGRVVTALEHTGSGIAVVRLTVVDCRESVNALQMLFARNRIHLQPELEGEKSRPASGAKSAPSEQLVAVYVESTSDRLAEAVAELRSDERFHKLKVDRPLSLAKLDHMSHEQKPAGPSPWASLRSRIASSQMQRLGGGFGGSGRLRTESIRNGQSKNAANRSAKRSTPALPARRFQHTEEGKKPVAGGGEQVEQWERISQQLKLTIPAEVLRQNAVVGPSQAARPASPRKAGRTALQSAVGAPRPVRVLFVLECPAPPARSKPAESKPPRPAKPRGRSPS